MISFFERGMCIASYPSEMSEVRGSFEDDCLKLPSSLYFNPCGLETWKIFYFTIKFIP